MLLFHRETPHNGFFLRWMKGFALIFFLFEKSYEGHQERICTVLGPSSQRFNLHPLHWIYMYISIFTNPSAREGYDTRSIFKRSLTGLNSEFSFSLTSCHTQAEEPSLPNYLPIAGGRMTGFISFPKVLVLCEMLSVSSRIWTRVAMSISCDDNHYTTGTSNIYMYISLRPY